MKKLLRFLSCLMIVSLVLGVSCIASAEGEVSSSPRYSTIKETRENVYKSEDYLVCQAICKTWESSKMEIQIIIKENVNGKTYTRLNKSGTYTGRDFVFTQKYLCKPGQKFSITIKYIAGNDKPIQNLEYYS